MMTLIDPSVVGTRDVEGDFRFNIAGSGKRFRSKFIEPGLVSYLNSGGGIELLRKETIDACLNTALGNALTCGHVIVTDENRLNVMHGEIDSVDYDPADGWYYANGDVTSELARTRMNSGQKPSCGYVVTSWGPGGTYHGIKYDREIAGIDFNHLAIVTNPRYEGATFRLNSLTSSPMNVFKFLKKKLTGAADAAPTIETHEVNGETMVPIDGKDYRLNDLAECWRVQKNQVFECCGTDTVEIDGAQVKMNELVETFRKNGFKVARENSALPITAPVDDAAKATAEAAAKVAADAEKVRLNALEVQKTTEAEAAAAAAAAAEAARKPEEKNDAFFTLHNARLNAAALAVASDPLPNFGTLGDKVRIGQARYGSTPAK